MLLLSLYSMRHRYLTEMSQKWDNYVLYHLNGSKFYKHKINFIHVIPIYKLAIPLYLLKKSRFVLY